jgi:thiamine pyrophosphokinase
MNSQIALISAGGRCGIERDVLRDNYKLIIGVDSGVSHLYKMFFHPTHLVGDFDSISRNDLSRAKKDNAIFIKLDQEKNKTDIEAAFELAISLNSDEIILIGGEEGEVDQLFGLFLLCSSFSDKIKITWKKKNYSIHFQNEITFDIAEGKIFSIIPITDLKKVVIKGAKWNILNKDFKFGSSESLRNESIGEIITIVIGSGIAAIAIKT